MPTPFVVLSCPFPPDLHHPPDEAAQGARLRSGRLDMHDGAHRDARSRAHGERCRDVHGCTYHHGQRERLCSPPHHPDLPGAR
ncbi:MAG: hypothetical protein JWQ68_619 [Cryobacterium sp.]|jgi:hypothetical protein|nr:hypothetical protein [Cryobacterium sp.]